VVYGTKGGGERCPRLSLSLSKRVVWVNVRRRVYGGWKAAGRNEGEDSILIQQTNLNARVAILDLRTYGPLPS